jgi:hypothetical protein
LKIIFTICSSPSLKDPAAWTENFNNILSNFVEVAPEDRAEFHDLLDHEFLKSACSKEQFADFVSKRLDSKK